MSIKTHILLAEDDDHIRQGLIDTLESENFNVTAAQNGQEAIDLHAENRFDLVILDNGLVTEFRIPGEKSANRRFQVLLGDTCHPKHALSSFPQSGLEGPKGMERV